MQVECPKHGWPNPDVEGRPQYTNTHFDDEREAWENVRANVEAGVSIDRRQVVALVAQLEMAKARLAKSIEEMETFDVAYQQRWQVAPAQGGPKETA